MPPLPPGTDPLSHILQRVATISGAHLDPFRRDFFFETIALRSRSLGLNTLDAYLDYLDHRPEEAFTLLNDTFVGFTHFFRDPQAFDALTHQLKRRLSAQSPPVHALVGACSTGQEAVSVLMLLERLHTDTSHFSVQASDINTQAIARARRGIFARSEVEALPPAMRERFFDAQGAHYRLHEAYQQKLHYEVRDLLRQPPPPGYDLICCRNLLIYLQPSAQQTLLQHLHHALAPGGLLFMGAYESAASRPDLFALVNAQHSIFTRRS
ncbi:hypothetical protein DL240_09325 [Lujinxingia litoralis]|uniref:CheR-type methyltransferase domain-containing protein n=1 Tax=Lujinxingia litoralis TaxID=2211119 RepID=A0A328C726_9DELT|nr:CheR family methyltransferase [Lujinxingia litoralis]RAL23076.1 hypothetical protein DL240_09325 [Lujinxingia litoralis]